MTSISLKNRNTRIIINYPQKQKSFFKEQYRNVFRINLYTPKSLLWASFHQPSSEVSWYSLLEWHLPEVMMNYLESDERVASSEVRPTCTPELRQTYSHASGNNNNIFFSPFFCLSKRKGRKKRTPRTFVALMARYRAYLIRFVVAQNRHPWLTSLNWLPAN